MDAGDGIDLGTAWLSVSGVPRNREGARKERMCDEDVDERDDGGRLQVTEHERI